MPLLSDYFKALNSKIKIKVHCESNVIEELMLISCEKDMVVDTEKVINNFASRSPALTKTLTY